MATWALLTTYAKTWEGLVACYAAGLPYLLNTVAGDALYAAILFGSLSWLEGRFPSLRTTLAPGRHRPRTS